MKILNITARVLRLPLRKPFVTALRVANAVENVLITIHTEDKNLCGLGEAAAIPAVTGETAGGIIYAVENNIAPRLVGQNAVNLLALAEIKERAVQGNASAKAGVEAALYDLYAKIMGVPLYRLLGGSGHAVPQNNLTVSASGAGQMVEDVTEAARAGFKYIKIKLGRSPETDGETLVTIFKEVSAERGYKPLAFRVDGNCGWTVKQAVKLISKWEDAGVPLEWVEQPVSRGDMAGLKAVTQNTLTPVMADESCFSERDAVCLLEARAADMVNVKLAKCGGISAALSIARICKAYNAPCLLGGMLESRLGSSVAAHVAATGLFCAIDLDGPLLCAADAFEGGTVFEGAGVRLNEDAGLGIKAVS